jgi:hypothetical protein
MTLDIERFEFNEWRVKPRPSNLWRFGQGLFAGGALTPPLTKGVYNPFGNPVQGDCIPLNPARHSSPPQVAGYSGGFL